MKLSDDGLPESLFTCYDQSNQLDRQKENAVLANGIRFVIETDRGTEILKSGKLHITEKNNASIG